MYAIRQISTGKYYVGQSIDIRARWRWHRRRATELGALICANPGDFEYLILHEVPEAQLSAYEQWWIEFLGCYRPDGFNTLEPKPYAAGVAKMRAKRKANREKLKAQFYVQQREYEARTRKGKP